MRDRQEQGGGVRLPEAEARGTLEVSAAALAFIEKEGKRLVISSDGHELHFETPAADVQSVELGSVLDLLESLHRSFINMGFDTGREGLQSLRDAEALLKAHGRLTARGSST